jgi:hypothetical protein
MWLGRQKLRRQIANPREPCSAWLALWVTRTEPLWLSAAHGCGFDVTGSRFFDP